MLVGGGCAAIVAGSYLLLRTGAREQSIASGPQIPLGAATLQLSDQLSAAHAGAILATSLQEGLRIVLRPAQADMDVVSEVIAGRSVFGLMDSIQFMAARQKRAPIVTFGAEFLDTPVAFFVLDTSGINSPMDFRGARVPRQPGTDSAIIYDALLANLGISRGEVKEVESRGSAATLINHSIDVLPGLVGVTDYELTAAGAGYNVVRPADYGIHVPGSVFFATEATMRDHPTVVDNFLRKIVGGWQKVYANQKVASEQVAAISALKLAQVAFQIKAQRDLVIPVERRIAEFDDLQWRQLRIILLQERLITEDTDFSSAIDHSILKDVYRRPLSYGQ